MKAFKNLFASALVLAALPEKVEAKVKQSDAKKS